jgi:hypothetical protein
VLRDAAPEERRAAIDAAIEAAQAGWHTCGADRWALPFL